MPTLNVVINEKAMRALRVEAAKNGKKMPEAVEDMIKKYAK